jgi:hypothetical protein
MTTIMTWKHSDGTKGGGCDAKCHNAKHAICVCMCGGRYHGVGSAAQSMFTKDMLEKVWVKALSEKAAEAGIQVQAAML